MKRCYFWCPISNARDDLELWLTVSTGRWVVPLVEVTRTDTTVIYESGSTDIIMNRGQYIIARVSNFFVGCVSLHAVYSGISEVLFHGVVKNHPRSYRHDAFEMNPVQGVELHLNVPEEALVTIITLYSLYRRVAPHQLPAVAVALLLNATI